MADLYVTISCQQVKNKNLTDISALARVNKIPLISQGNRMKNSPKRRFHRTDEQIRVKQRKFSKRILCGNLQRRCTPFVLIDDTKIIVFYRPGWSSTRQLHPSAVIDQSE
ncbi:hypothetical protein EG68_07936 [Paragonimus skrjabini miyazakii]|uniref:Uncharacterized protein n=1 Tax=Paragonimus skrjabini miyazakii TaxID=59628 RepID=A0A8S9YNT5_9TREM|nr:hypothetical protein EG68_07936 [Paragonimus skrjabini miyazakii]